MVHVPVAVGAGGGVAVGRTGVKAVVGDAAATGDAALVAEAAPGTEVGETVVAPGAVLLGASAVGETEAGEGTVLALPMRVGEIPLRPTVGAVVGLVVAPGVEAGAGARVHETSSIAA